MRYLAAFLLFIALTGCVSLQPIDNSSIKSYVFNPTLQNITRTSSTKQVLLVMPVQTNAVYDTHHMLYSLQPYQLAYFSKNRWADTPATMLQPWLTQALQQTQHFAAVVTPPFSAHYNYILDTQLVKLQQNFWQKPSQVQLVVNVQLINTSTQKLVAAKQFVLEKTAPTDDPAGGVVAVNQAISSLLTQISRFVITTI